MLGNLVSGFQNIFTIKILKVFSYLKDIQNFQHFECFFKSQSFPKAFICGQK